MKLLRRLTTTLLLLSLYMSTLTPLAFAQSSNVQKIATTKNIDADDDSNDQLIAALTAWIATKYIYQCQGGPAGLPADVILGAGAALVYLYGEYQAYEKFESIGEKVDKFVAGFKYNKQLTGEQKASIEEAISVYKDLLAAIKTKQKIQQTVMAAYLVAAGLATYQQIQFNAAKGECLAAITTGTSCIKNDASASAALESAAALGMVTTCGMPEPSSKVACTSYNADNAIAEKEIVLVGNATTACEAAIAAVKNKIVVHQNSGKQPSVTEYSTLQGITKLESGANADCVGSLTALGVTQPTLAKPFLIPCQSTTALITKACATAIMIEESGYSACTPIFTASNNNIQHNLNMMIVRNNDLEMKIREKLEDHLFKLSLFYPTFDSTQFIPQKVVHNEKTSSYNFSRLLMDNASAADFFKFLGTKLSVPMVVALGTALWKRSDIYHAVPWGRAIGWGVAAKMTLTAADKTGSIGDDLEKNIKYLENIRDGLADETATNVATPQLAGLGTSFGSMRANAAKSKGAVMPKLCVTQNCSSFTAAINGTNFNFAGLPGLMGDMSIFGNAVDQIQQGRNPFAGAGGAALNNFSARASAYKKMNKELQAQINKDLEKMKMSPTNFDQMEGDHLNGLVAAARGATKNPNFGKGMLADQEKLKDEEKSELVAALVPGKVKMEEGKLPNAADAAAPSFNFRMKEEKKEDMGASAPPMDASNALNDYEVPKNDIIESEEVNIFQALSVRYLKTAYPHFFEKR